MAARFSVDASVRIETEDPAGIERLVRYCARPPFALERLHALDSGPALALPEGRLIYRLPRPDIHGRTELLLTPLELLEALAKFVPPPRVHRHRYHGVLAPNARLRPHVVALGRPELVSEAPAAESDAASPSLPSGPAPAPASPTRAERPQRTGESAASGLPRDDRGSPRRGDRRSIRWAVLLARIYAVLPLLCPACGGEMRILALAFGELASLGSDRSARGLRHPPPPRPGAPAQRTLR
ncbi:MAG TPA: transposase, partial [Longimicrobiales bacterium]|nr:transposase [Longimicrobiales bacterium]